MSNMISVSVFCATLVAIAVGFLVMLAVAISPRWTLSDTVMGCILVSTGFLSTYCIVEGFVGLIKTLQVAL